MTAPYTQAYVFALDAENEQQWAGTLATGDGMGVGQHGTDSTLENALSYSNLFGLKTNEAKTIVQTTRELARQLPAYLTQSGLTEADINIATGTFSPDFNRYQER